jgi:hypothetical protein
MKKTVYIYGGPDQEHLRLEREGELANLISHEFKPGAGAQSSRYLDRYLIGDIEFDKLVNAIDQLKSD